MLRFTLFAVLAIAALLSLPSSSQAVEIDFSIIAAPGNLGSPTFTDPATGLTVSGFWFNPVTQAWEPANLYVRNVAGDHGVGVCNPAEMLAGGGDCPGPGGGGDVNELDNSGQSELIVLSLPLGFEWVSVQVSSLDNNGGAPDPERGILYADSDGVPNNVPPPGGNFGDTVIETFTGGVDPLEAVFLIDPASSNSPFLIFEPFDHTGGGATNNDYLVYKATIEVPEGGQGCTPGFWKKAHHFDEWVGFDPGEDYETVFGITTISPSFTAETLAEVLNQGGGGEMALGRHAVAALLNSTSPDVNFGFTTAEVIALVQGAYVSGDFEGVKNQLAAENELGAPPFCD
jgi:hypothetical protein